MTFAAYGLVAPTVPPCDLLVWLERIRWPGLWRIEHLRWRTGS